MEPESIPDSADEIAQGKRKRSDGDASEHFPAPGHDEEATGGSSTQHFQGHTPPPEGKKPRLDPFLDTKTGHDPGTLSPDINAILPAEILQHVFSFVDPFSLGQLMVVCRAFNDLLNPLKTLPAGSPDIKHLRLQSQNDVWVTSRRRFSPKFPRPMDGMTELQLWKLVHGVSCQFCGKKPLKKLPALASSPWSSGPGPEGVRAIWPFQVRSCGTCIEARLVKETEVLLSSSSILLPGLPFALFTPSFNYVTSTILRQTQPPPNLHLTKYFFRPQVDDLSQELANARELGDAATSEWYKGLEARGRDHALDAARLEQWEMQNTPVANLEHGPTSHQSDSTSPNPSLASTANFSHKFNLQSPQWPGSSQGTPMQPASNFASPLYGGPAPMMPFPSYHPAPGQTKTHETQLAPGSFQAPTSATIIDKIQHQPARNRPEDIAQKKADRRVEIERRCQELDPPIMPSTLEFMDAFNAAIQIPMTLNDNAWDVLKDRLLAQRREAEQKERDSKSIVQGAKVNQGESSQAKNERSKAQAETDRIWAEIQKPLREKIKAFADQFVSSNWANGMAVNKGSSGRFAADVLQYVKGRYLDLIAKEDKLLVGQSMTIPPDSNLHEERRLKLEDMKWIYEEAVKPHTERFGKDIFLCSICEATTKKFSFDAVIQHYAAKHTSSLSRGSAVVSWKADWPLEPPFHPAPDTLWHRESNHQIAASSQYATSPAWTPFTSASWMSPMPPGQPNGIYIVQCEEVVSSARHAWDVLDSHPPLHDSIRLFVVIHQVALGFAKKFMNKPTLSMFTDCVLHKPALRPLKELNGLRCKVCHSNIPPGFTTASNEFDLPDLLSHFQKLHIEIDLRSPHSSYGRPTSMAGMEPPRLDWEVDMVQLPHDSVIQNLASVPGLSAAKFDMIAAAFPAFFPRPLRYFDQEGVRPTVVYEPGRSSQEQFQSTQRAQMPPPEDLYRDHAHSYVRTISSPTNHRDAYDPRNPRPFYVRDHRNQDRNVEGMTMLDDRHPQEVIYVERAGVHRPEQRYSSQPMDYIAGSPRSHRSVGTQPRLFRDAYVGDALTGPASHYQVSHSAPPDEKIADPIPAETLRSFADSYGHPRSISPERRVESVPVAEPDANITAAERFLNNFDPYAGDVMADVHGSDRAAGSRHHSSAVTPLRPQPSAERLVSHGTGSHRQSPRASTSSRHLSRDGSPVPAFDVTSHTPLCQVTTTEHDGIPQERLSPVPRHPPPGYDREDDPQRYPEYGNVREHGWHGDRVEQRLVDSRDYHGPRGAYRSPPLPQHYQRRTQPTRPIRYIEILPDGRQRLVEELPSPMMERVEYVRASPPERRREYHDEFAFVGTNHPREHHPRGDAFHPEPFYDQGRQYEPYVAGPSSQMLPPRTRNLRYPEEEAEDLDDPR